MEIHLLTFDAATDERLERLLQSLDQTCTIHHDVDTLVKASKRLNKESAVFYDLRLENKLWAFERLYTSCKRTNLVGFEPLTDETAQGGNNSTEGVEHYLLLAKNEDRARARVQEVLRAIRQSAVKRKTAAATKKLKKACAAQQKATGGIALGNAAATSAVGKLAPGTTLPAASRYLEARSPAMVQFMQALHSSATGNHVIVIEGEEGAEFELVAREVNYSVTGDVLPLFALDPMHYERDELMAAFQEALAKKEVRYCYLGVTADVSNASAKVLSEFIETYRTDKSGYFRLIIGHVHDSQSYFASGASTVINTLRDEGQTLALPGMGERKEDVAGIVQRVFSTLRMAHPFFNVRTIPVETVEFFEQRCDDFDYSRLVRVLRNSLALCQKSVLGPDEVRSFADNGVTSQHLIESFADERFFGSDEEEEAESANDVA